MPGSPTNANSPWLQGTLVGPDQSSCDEGLNTERTHAACHPPLPSSIKTSRTMKITVVILFVSILLQITHGAKSTNETTVKPPRERELDVKRTRSSLAKPLAVSIGTLILRPTLGALKKVVNLSHMTADLGTNALKLILSSVGLAMTESHEILNAFNVPGWGYVMYFPNKFMSVVEEGTKKFMTMEIEGERLIRAGEALTIYHALNVISKTIGLVMRLIGKDCMSLKPQTLDVRLPLKLPVKLPGKLPPVTKIEISKINVCGLSHLQPENLVKVRNSQNKLLIIKIPYVAKQLTVDFCNISILILGRNLFDHRSMKVSINRAFLNGQVEFHIGTGIRFERIRLRVKEVNDLRVSIPGKHNETYVMGVMEYLSPLLAQEVKKKLNEEFKKLERRLTEEIKRRARKPSHKKLFAGEKTTYSKSEEDLPT